MYKFSAGIPKLFSPFAIAEAINFRIGSALFLLTNFKIYTMKELDELKIVQLKEIESYFWNYRLKIKSVLEYKQAMENEE